MINLTQKMNFVHLFISALVPVCSVIDSDVINYKSFINGL